MSDFQLVQLYTVAHLNWEGDGITALYRGDELIMEGDYYHDKIDDRIEGFFSGLDEAGHDYGRRDIYVSGTDFQDCNAPSGLDELKDGYRWTLEPIEYDDIDDKDDDEDPCDDCGNLRGTDPECETCG